MISKTLKTEILLILLIVSLLFASSASAEIWHVADSAIVSWTKSNTVSGEPLESGEAIKYYVYLKKPDGSNIHVIGTYQPEDQQAADVSYTVVLDARGKHHVGVSAVVVWLDDNSEYGENEVAWSDNPVDCLNGETFGLVRIHVPTKPKDLKK